MIRFETLGPFPVPYEGSADRKFIRAADVRDFWDDHEEYALRKGVYIFGVRAGRGGYKPIYIGKATKTFRQEAFTPRNLQNYNHGLRAWKASCPVMFFVMHPEQRGRANKRAVSEVEVVFIKLGKKVNPDLKNTHHMGDASWEVDSMQASRAPTKAIRAFRRMMKIN